MAFIVPLLRDILDTFLLMAPYLMLGLVMAGVLHVLFTKQFVLKHLGTSSIGSTIKASILGVPLPLCSCGVLPMALSLRKNKASEGATISFLISTPQTGVDSIVATWGIMGAPFAVLRAAAAFIMGITGGIITNFLGAETAQPSPEEQQRFSCSLCYHTHPHSHSILEKVRRMVRYAFVDFLDDISLHLVIGIVISGCIAFFVPEELFSRYITSELASMLLMIVAGIPLYICATASIPIAATLMMKGLSPGAAFVFLAVGPATNAASITLILHAMGKRIVAIYLGVIALLSIGAGLGINRVFAFFDYDPPVGAIKHGHTESPGIFMIGVAALFALVLGLSVGRSLFPTLWGKLKRVLVPAKAVPDQSHAQHLHEATVTVGGMTCESCTRKVTAALSSLPGVDHVDVDLQTQKVSVYGQFQLSEIHDALTRAGYEPGE